MVVGNENIQFSGAAPSFQTVNQIQKDLETIPFLSKVVIASATQERSGNRIQFKISADFGESDFGQANAGQANVGGGFNYGRFSSNRFERRLDSGSPQAPPGMTVLVGRRYNRNPNKGRDVHGG